MNREELRKEFEKETGYIIIDGGSDYHFYINDCPTTFDVYYSKYSEWLEEKYIDSLTTEQQPTVSDEEIERMFPYEDIINASKTRPESRIRKYNARQMDRREGAKALRDKLTPSDSGTRSEIAERIMKDTPQSVKDESRSFVNGEIRARVRQSFIKNVWQKWCELDGEDFDEWMRDKLTNTLRS